MKKLLLSLAVVILFFFYSAYKQNNNSLLASSSTSPTPPPDYNAPTNLPLLTDTATPQNPSNGMMGKQTGTMMGLYKDGVYTGDVVDVFYGNVQIQTTIQNGKISDVKFLQSPSDRRTSIEINSQAMPILQSEVIQAQSANVDGVSGATSTSQGFVASLGSALAKAK